MLGVQRKMIKTIRGTKKRNNELVSRNKIINSEFYMYLNEPPDEIMSGGFSMQPAILFATTSINKYISHNPLSLCALSQ
jgi:hypothetical protein